MHRMLISHQRNQNDNISASFGGCVCCQLSNGIKRFSVTTCNKQILQETFPRWSQRKVRL